MLLSLFDCTKFLTLPSLLTCVLVLLFRWFLYFVEMGFTCRQGTTFSLLTLQQQLSAYTNTVYQALSSLHYIILIIIVAAARTCHCPASQQSCRPDGKCQSLIGEDNFSCLVTRRYNRLSGEHIIIQQCIHDIIDYAIYCNGPKTGGLVFNVSLIF